jgi:peptidoglycan hydrolase-like protein with peptidoglycan-binding domain
MKSRQKQLAGCLVLIALGWCLQPLSSTAATPVKSSKKPASKKTVKSSTTQKSGKRYAKRRSSFRYRLANLKPSADRVTEIQQALIREGYLKQEATGKWDDSTREAMRSYQQANGFATTGLPDSKSLMKLGLGPHALPEDADPSVAGRASINPPSKSDPSAQTQPSVSGPQTNPNDRP